MFETDAADGGASWIPAAEALRIVTDLIGEDDAQPAIFAGARKGAIRARARAGASTGSFWPSPSSMTTMGARAAMTPVRMARL